MAKLVHPCGLVVLTNGCAPSLGRCHLPSHCFCSGTRLRDVPHCLPEVTHSSAIMRNSQHREASLSLSPSQGESLLSPFLPASNTRHKLLNPWIQFCETRREQFCRASEVESGIFHSAGLSCHPPGSGERERGYGGEYSERACEIFWPRLNRVRKRERKEPERFDKVGQPGKDRRRKEAAQLCRSRLLCICNMSQKLSVGSQTRQAWPFYYGWLQRRTRGEGSGERENRCKEFKIKPSMELWDGFEQCTQPCDLN